MTVEPPIIPTEFVRLDTRTTAANSYVNVHDMRKGYENHNVLIARRLKRTVLTMGTPFTLRGGFPLNSNFAAPPALEIPIKLSARVSELDVNFYGRRAGVNCYLYFSVDSINGQRPLDSTQGITVSATSNTLQSLSVKVPAEAEAAGEGVLRVYAVTPVNTINKDADEIVVLRSDSITVRDNTLSSTDCGKYLILGTISGGGSFTHFFDMRPKMITSISHHHPNGHGGGSADRTIHFQPSLEYTPDVTDLGYQIIESGTIQFQSLSVYEKPLTPATGFYDERYL